LHYSSLAAHATQKTPTLISRNKLFVTNMQRLPTVCLLYTVALFQMVLPCFQRLQKKHRNGEKMAQLFTA
jgi:hypothetical protein